MPAYQGYGPNAGRSNTTDPRGRLQNQSQYQQDRYESQQGPLADAMAYNYGRGSEADYGNYTDIMNQYRDIASGGYGGGGGGGVDDGGGGGGGYDAFTVNPERVSAQQASAERANTERATAARALSPLERISARSLNPLERVSAKDQFATPEAGYQEFSQTGGYSPTDIANMRARGTAPIRAAYANAERNVAQQRGLQGGYSPNAIAAQIKMAREQGQGMADASQAVDAGIIANRNAGRLSGFGGLTDIGAQRQNAQMQGDIFNAGEARQANQFDIGNELDAAKYNADQAFQGQKFDIGNEMDINKFNVGEGNQVGMFNAGQGNDVSMFNAGQGNDVGQFNANLNYQGQVYNADAQTQAQARNNAAGEAAAGRRAAASAADMDNRLAALSGMRSLYGTTPGMSETFGNQAANIVGQGGTFGLNLYGRDIESQQQPGQFDQTMNRVNQFGNLASKGMDVASGFLKDRSNPQTSSGNATYRTPSGSGGSGIMSGVNFSNQTPNYGITPTNTRRIGSNVRF